MRDSELWIFGEEREKFLKHKLMSTVIIRFKKILTPKKAISHHVLTTSVSENNKHLLRRHPIEGKKNYTLISDKTLTQTYMKHLQRSTIKKPIAP